jgi:hypothetical protein
MTAGRTLEYTVLFMFWIVPASVAYASTSPIPSHCVFDRVGDHFGGSCGALFDQTPAMTLSPATGITTGVWRDDVHPASVWAGDMTDQGYRNAPLELEIYTGGWGVLRTEYGWFAVREIVDKRTATRNYHHRLMDYNNDPTTHLDDVQSLFKDALNRIEKP